METEIPKKPEILFPNTYQITIKIFGIPIYSFSRTIDEDKLYERMSARFNHEIEKEIEKQRNKN